MSAPRAGSEDRDRRLVAGGGRLGSEEVADQGDEVEHASPLPEALLAKPQPISPRARALSPRIVSREGLRASSPIGTGCSLPRVAPKSAADFRKMHQTTIRFGDDLWLALEAECGRLDISIAQYVRDSALARLAYGVGHDDGHRFASVFDAVGSRPASDAEARATRRALTEDDAPTEGPGQGQRARASRNKRR